MNTRTHTQKHGNWCSYGGRFLSWMMMYIFFFIHFRFNIEKQKLNMAGIVFFGHKNTHTNRESAASFWVKTAAHSRRKKNT